MDFDSIQDSLENKHRGSSGKRHPSHHGSKTNKFIQNEFINNSKENRIEESRKKLEKIILSFPDFDGNEDLRNKYLDRYVGWLKTSLRLGSLIFRDKDIKMESYRSSGRGGQNVNKVETAVRIIHEISNITVENEEERTQEQNRENATKLLKKKLVHHLEDWVDYLDGKDPESLTRYDLLEVPSNKLTF